MIRNVFLCLLIFSGFAAAAPVLDPQFGGQGIKLFEAAGAYARVVGACPHANGQASIVAFSNETTQWLIARVDANGVLDPSYSGDGIASAPLASRVTELEDLSVTCIGAGNADPNDDAMLVAAVTVRPMVSARVLMVTQLDLDAGSLDVGFNGGATAMMDISPLMAPYDPETGDTDWRGVRVRGVFPGATGEWLVMGALVMDQNNTMGFMLRVSAGGGLIAWNAPAPYDNWEVREIHAARLHTDGSIRALARIKSGTNQRWGLLRLAGANLSVGGLPAIGDATSQDYGYLRGRLISGGFVVPVIAPGAAPFGTAPRLLVIRGDDVDDLALPPPGPIGSEATGFAGTMAATIANDQRVIVGMGLVTLSNPVAGYYVAMVKLGDGAGIPDTIDAGFGDQGSSVFRFEPVNVGCSAGQAPPQHFVNLSSWGNTTLIAGNAAPRCYDEANGSSERAPGCSVRESTTLRACCSAMDLSRRPELPSLRARRARQSRSCVEAQSKQQIAADCRDAALLAMTIQRV
ncbi:MAG: hypothetical protein IPK97_01345 [Ahniella sp.]|nr:hypothetical protein [Ahniella sp.]